jgi:formiminoglutamase
LFDSNFLFLAIVGFPYDQGCIRNGGRYGAAGAPAVFRNFIKVMGTVGNPEFDEADFSRIRLIDAGDVQIQDGQEVEFAWQMLREKVAGLVGRGIIPFVVGGSNDQSFSNACGLMDVVGGQVGIVNIDAHLDVRPQKNGKEHSGSPFRQLLESKQFQGKFMEFAAQGNQCSKIHADYVISKGHRITWLSVLRSSNVAQEWNNCLTYIKRETNSIFISFDLDAVSGMIP